MKTITKLNVSKECPRFESCNSAFCPASMEGLHLRDEAICKYFRLISRDETSDIPQVIIDAITGNEPCFLDDDFRGFMSQYKCIKNMGSAL
ncbi:MAG: hypothetical protein K0U38_09890 [Epsilonproteobacteria bacterium]|nr:hypothetical protein [Campylobacterota bacterium]